MKKSRGWIGMIIRARPKYLRGLNEGELIASGSEGFNEFYFSSGRAALKFFLTILSKIHGREVRIGMQSFNCRVVLDAALQANCKVFLFDVKNQDFSIELESLKKHCNKIDVLLLTHYQGIPNFQYKEIADFCNDKSIVLIEDLAQTFGSSVAGKKVGELGDVLLNSYSFDKPFTSMSGGMIKILNKCSKYLGFFREHFSVLEEESFDNATLDLRTLWNLYFFSSERIFKNGMDNYELMRLLTKQNLPRRTIWKCLRFLGNRYVSYIASKAIPFRFYNQERFITVGKMNRVKINFLSHQIRNYNYDFSKVSFVEELGKKFRLDSVKLSDATIHWNRYSIVDSKRELRAFLLESGYQVGNFNWPVSLDFFSKYSDRVFVLEEAKISHYLCKNILNVPVWL